MQGGSANTFGKVRIGNPPNRRASGRPEQSAYPVCGRRSLWPVHPKRNPLSRVALGVSDVLHALPAGNFARHAAIHFWIPVVDGWTNGNGGVQRIHVWRCDGDSRSDDDVCGPCQEAQSRVNFRNLQSRRAARGPDLCQVPRSRSCCRAGQRWSHGFWSNPPLAGGGHRSRSHRTAAQLLWHSRRFYRLCRDMPRPQGFVCSQRYCVHARRAQNTRWMGGRHCLRRRAKSGSAAQLRRSVHWLPLHAQILSPQNAGTSCRSYNRRGG